MQVRVYGTTRLMRGTYSDAGRGAHSSVPPPWPRDGHSPLSGCSEGNAPPASPSPTTMPFDWRDHV